MRLEHRKQKVVPLQHFLYRLGVYGLFAMGLILFSVMVGMAGYHHFGDISWLDSFYMACLILSGVGPLVEMTTFSAKIFSSLFVLHSGVAFFSITAVFFSPIYHRLFHILNLGDADLKLKAEKIKKE